MCLDYKKEGKFRDINVGVISLIGVGALIAYIRNTQQFFWIVLLGGVVLLLLYIIYVPAFSRKWRAKKTAGKKGSYNVRLQNDKIKYGDKNESIEMTGKNTEVYISEKLYVLRVNREVFTIPKRIMKEKEEQEVKVKKSCIFSAVVIIDRDGSSQFGKWGCIPGGVECSYKLDFKKFFMGI